VCRWLIPASDECDAEQHEACEISGGRTDLHWGEIGDNISVEYLLLIEHASKEIISFPKLHKG
jgi:hypothetical protein